MIYEKDAATLVFPKIAQVNVMRAKVGVSTVLIVEEADATRVPFLCENLGYLRWITSNRECEKHSRD